MSSNRVAELVDTYWEGAEEAIAGLDDAQYARLAAAIGALDTVWDRHIFESAETFGGPEIRYARILSALILTRLLGVDFAALPSLGGSDLRPTGSDTLDEGLAAACREALDTFSSDLLGPVDLGGRLVYAKPMLLDGPLPIGAAVLVARAPLTAQHESLLDVFLRHFDTRLDVAERILKLRRDSLEVSYELRRLKGELPKPDTIEKPRRRRGVARVVVAEPELAASVPVFALFGVHLPGQAFGVFCNELHDVTNGYLDILDAAPELYLDVPSGVDAKSDHRLAAPYARLLEMMDSLRQVAPLLSRITADELTPVTAAGRAPTFADLTRAAAAGAGDDTTSRVLEIMNDQSEEAELDALSARQHPFEFRAANVGEVFALLALHRTATSELGDELRAIERLILEALSTYQAARAYLLSFDRLEDVPLKGVSRTEPPEAEKLLLLREQAPSFGVLLRAYAR